MWENNLSSTIIKDLKKATSYSQAFLYFYFNFPDTSKQSHKGIICSFIDQLLYKQRGTWEELNLLFDSGKEGHEQLTTESLCTTLLDMIQKLGQVWIVLDTLDECDIRKRTEELLPWIKDLVSKQTNVHVLVTSRPEQEIEAPIKE